MPKLTAQEKTIKYWQERMDEIMAYIDRTDLDFFYELQEIYADSAKSIQAEIYDFYDKYAEDNQITWQEAKQRLSRMDLSDYRKNAEKYRKQAEKDPELLKRLNEQYQSSKVTRLDALHLEIEYELGKMNKTIQKSYLSYVQSVAKYAYQKIAGGMSASTLNRPAMNQLVRTVFNGKNYSPNVWGNTDRLGDNLKEVFKKGFVRGLGPADMARELRKKYNVSRAQAEALVRTDGTNIINNATLKRYHEAGLTKYQFHAHIDDRTTEICTELNEEIFDIVDYQPGVNAPPMHVNCRSTIIPTEEELGMEEEESYEELEELGMEEDE